MARILIADDDIDLADAWRRALDAEGHDVSVQTTTADTLRIASRVTPDLVIAELVMAGGGGLGLGGRLKLLAPDIKVIITSGHPAALTPTVDGLRLARRAGADIALAKPLSTEALLNAVREALAKPGVGQQPDAELPPRTGGASVHVTGVNGRQRPGSELK